MLFDNSNDFEVDFVTFHQDTWSFFTSFQSTSIVQAFLKQQYESLGLPNAEFKSYENCYAFIYYIEHGKKYYQLAKNAPDELKPVLLFYGMVQLIKATLLTVDPDYPQTTTVLAHGVSARKRKKRDYIFLNDEVKVQKNGLLRHFAQHLFQETLSEERFQIESLFARIPEMNAIFQMSGKQHPSLKVKQQTNGTLIIPISILDHLHMTARRFQEYLQRHLRVQIQSFSIKEENIIIVANLNRPFDCVPFLFHLSHDVYIPKKRELFQPIPELIVHYLLLYNLSMLCRYETEWWNELFHSFSTDDLPFIRHFLSISERKTPYLIGLYLKKRSDQ